ncbi:MAG: TetR/AcrR family transcriptional regulator, partial [Dehalococcoidia bacterium]
MRTAGGTTTPRPKRLTRAESKAITKARLLDAAATVFARKGFAATSVEDIAEAAGYTIGALYSNFSGKEDLFLAVLDQHLAADAELIAEILGEASSGEDLLRRLAAYFDAMYEAEQDWRLLTNEFRLYVARNPRFNSRLAEQKQAAL